MPGLDLDSDIVDLTAAICDVESVSGHEQALADAVEMALLPYAHLQVDRVGNVVVARTGLGRPERVILAGHLDTVPLTDPPNLPTRRQDGPLGEELWGRGTVDMKGGVAVQLRLAARLTAPTRDVTYVFYDCEEVESVRNGLGRVIASHPQLMDADFAVLLEPTRAEVEGGCKGTLRVRLSARGIAAHSGRPWLGENAIHKLSPALSVLASYQARDVDVDGLSFREGLSAVGIEGGAGNNVIPDRASLLVNYRFAPDLTGEQAVAQMRELFAGYDLEVVDLAEGARPGLDRPAARDFVAALGVPVVAKQGWTDVARFSALGVPAVNFGPGDPLLAHKDDERVPVVQLRAAEEALARWLS
ncbi:putative succinyl-diaminopimelate desuccinylase DapE [Austwickia sp. TVS 96-490-7B]|uniref:succinyl-diaminopimelate desuccinylase n=1 Tax=Austwickia sp. TVS 96-490-7B TaxID=2830843 RepID=UPI001C561C93|nr:succinyl-diaminopimelate desuccinylase [Austwickia sp. TVS 96-490-7B]MBW3085925.1 putative succinyl-diaminopimelate desuccinylase DapE [Austwickia sp. TVS 96-490-7B]